jgi:hypothetical protein
MSFCSLNLDLKVVIKQDLAVHFGPFALFLEQVSPAMRCANPSRIRQRNLMILLSAFHN